MVTSVSGASEGTVPEASASGDGRLTHAAREFESVLLGQWLQNAESSFADVPGGDEDADAGDEQMHGFATQQLAGQLTASGGIGIARMVEKGLVKASEQQNAKAAGAGDEGGLGSTVAGAQRAARAMAAYGTAGEP